MRFPGKRHGLIALTTISATALLAAGGAAASTSATPTPKPADKRGESTVGPEEHKGNYDARTPSAKAMSARAAKESDASEKFRNSLGTQGVVEVDANTGTPAQVTKLDGFLTGKSAKKAQDVALGYVKAHPEVFKLAAADLATLRLRKDYVDDLGTHHIFWTQVVDGIEVFGNGLKANVTKHGQLISIMGAPIAGLTTQAQAETATPTVSADKARTTAAEDIGGKAKSVPATVTGVVTKWSNGDTAKQVWFHTADGLRKGWMTYVTTGATKSYTHVIDAQTGRLLYRRDLTSKASAESPASSTSPAAAPATSPIAPQSGQPGHEPKPARAGDALVFDNYPGAPRGGTQQVENLIRNGWLPKDAKTLLEGTSVSAWAELNAEFDLDDYTHPDAGETVKVPGSQAGAEYKLVPFQNASDFCSTSYICTWDPAKPDSWKTNLHQDVTNAFYLASNFHDWLAKPPISFTPAAGSFDAAGGDPVHVMTLVGAGVDYFGDGDNGPDLIDNAMMSTPPDGAPPQMFMFLFRPVTIPTDPPTTYSFLPSSSANDASILYHEYTHGLSGRLVVDATGNSTLDNFQAGSMGEAWSDFYAMDYLVAHHLERDTNAPGEVLEGKYVGHGELFRTQAIDCPVGAVAPTCVGEDGSKGGYTYGDLPTISSKYGPEVHASGEVWAQTLWDLRERLGHSYAMSLITRGMELSPNSPSMLDMRNAIVQADLVASGGKNTDAIWTVFANRGMGWFASALDGNDVQPAEDFHKPPKRVTPTTVTGIITDEDTGAPLADSLVSILGHTSGYAGDYSAVTDADGNYTINNVLPGTYGKVLVSGPGYITQVVPLTIEAGGTTANFTLRRNWASAAGGGQVVGFNGPDYSEIGCGPSNAIDDSSYGGWESTTGADETPTNVMIPKNIDIKLPEKVTISAFNVDPSDACWAPSSSTGKYRIETSADGATWATAQEGEFTAANQGKYNLVTPIGNATGVQYVRFWMLSPQVPDFTTNCPSSPTGLRYGGCQYTGMTEIQVFGSS